MIYDLIAACRALGETEVVAAGSMYATTSVQDEDCMKLVNAIIWWVLD